MAIRTQNQTKTTSGGAQNEDEQSQQRGLVGEVGPLEVNWPRTAGYYGGITAALALGMIDLPIAAFIAAVPFFKMLNRPNASQPAWIAGEVLQGVAHPVGGSGDPVLRVSDKPRPPSGGDFSGRLAQRVRAPFDAMWAEAHAVRNGSR